MDILHLLLHFDRALGTFIAEYGMLVYLLLFLVVFSEMGLLPLFFLPGDPLLFICGTFCGAGMMNLWGTLATLFFAATAGSLLNYRIGRAVGAQAYTRNFRWLDREALQRTHAFYEAHGTLTFLLSPYIAVVRTFAPFIAGVSAMRLPGFLLSMVLGAAIWVGGLVAAGYFFGNLPFVHAHLNAIVLAGIGAGLGALAASWAWRRFIRRHS